MTRRRWGSHRLDVVGVIAGALLGLPAIARAQPPSRGFLHITGGVQASSTDFSDTVVLVANAESVGASVDHTVDVGPLVDVSAGIIVGGRFALGAGVTYFAQDGEAMIRAGIPHPFFFNRDRPIEGTTTAPRTEVAVHLQAHWLLVDNDTLLATVFGGPSLFNVEQDRVQDVSFEDAFPFETATFRSASKMTQSESAVGFHVGADVAVFFSTHVGVGGLVRYSQAMVDLPSGGNNDARTVDAGGLHVGGGLRIRF